MKLQIKRGNDLTEIEYIDPGQIAEIQKSGNKFHEFGMLEDIARMKIKEGIFVDIGAHVGNHSIFFSKYCGRMVVAYEASPFTFETLLKNTTSRVVPINEAIGSEEGKCAVLHNEERPGQSKTSEGNEINIGPLPLNLLSVALIKIDVEGTELDVVKGCLEIINRDKPELFIETFGDPNDILSLLPKGYVKLKRYNNAPTYHFSWTGK